MLPIIFGIVFLIVITAITIFAVAKVKTLVASLAIQVLSAAVNFFFFFWLALTWAQLAIVIGFFAVSLIAFKSVTAFNNQKSEEPVAA